MPDKETIDYIFNYFSELMTLKEAAANRHHITSYKFRRSLSDDATGEGESLLRKRQWLSDDKDVLSLLEGGYESFRSRTAERIWKESADRIYFNRCPKCDRLARTPQAKQCRYCRYTWHHYVVATFKITSAFQLVKRPFFLLGDILDGEIKTGMRADLTTLGLPIKPTITAIEFARIHEQGAVAESTGLGLLGMSEADKDFIKTNSPFLKPIFIEDQNASQRGSLPLPDLARQ